MFSRSDIHPANSRKFHSRLCKFLLVCIITFANHLHSRSPKWKNTHDPGKKFTGQVIFGVGGYHHTYFLILARVATFHFSNLPSSFKLLRQKEDCALVDFPTDSVTSSFAHTRRRAPRMPDKGRAEVQRKDLHCKSPGRTWQHYLWGHYGDFPTQKCI